MYCSKDFQTRMMSRLPRESLKKNILFLFELSPIANLELENCNQDILKTVIARSFKLGQLIEGDKYIDCLVKIKTSCLFFSIYLPLQIWTSKIYNRDISKSIIGMSFKLCQLI